MVDIYDTSVITLWETQLGWASHLLVRVWGLLKEQVKARTGISLDKSKFSFLNEKVSEGIEIIFAHICITESAERSQTFLVIRIGSGNALYCIELPAALGDELKRLLDTWKISPRGRLRQSWMDWDRWKRLFHYRTFDHHHSLVCNKEDKSQKLILHKLGYESETDVLLISAMTKEFPASNIEEGMKIVMHTVTASDSESSGGASS